VAKSQCTSAENSSVELTDKAAPKLQAMCCCSFSELEREFQYLLNGTCSSSRTESSKCGIFDQDKARANPKQSIR
jgi:hypothetical protein